MRVLVGVVAVAAIIVFFAPPDNVVVEAADRPPPVARESQARAVPAALPGSDAPVPALLRPRLQDPEGSALFAVPDRHQASPAPAPEPEAAPAPPAPTAPPLPFRMVGQLQQENGTMYVLEHDGRTNIVSVGDTIDGQYVLERAEADVLVFRYLPLQQLQNLAFQVQP